MTDILNSGGMLLYFGIIILIFYFFIIRPQSKKQKERQAMLEAIKKGDDVITVGGVHGKVLSFKSDGKIVVIKVDDNVKLTVDRTAIAGMKGDEVETGPQQK